MRKKEIKKNVKYICTVSRAYNIYIRLELYYNNIKRFALIIGIKIYTILI